MNFKILNTVRQEANIRRETYFVGYGLHTAKKCRLVIKGNLKKDGIIFIYKGIEKKIESKNLDTQGRTTSVIHDGKIFLMCIEHLMSALYGLGISNAIIEVKGGSEIPILSGDSYSFVEKLIHNISIVTTESKSIAIKKPMIIYDDHDKERFIKISPHKDFSLQISSYAHYVGGYAKKQSYTFDFKDTGSYVEEISHARTSFPLIVQDSTELIQLQKRLRGAVLKGEYRNVNVCFGDEAPITYYDNEIARHKILDFLGDIRTASINLVYTKIELHKTGHSLNIKVASFLQGEFEGYSKEM